MGMKNKAHDLSTYPFSCGEPFLIDANVWIYLHPPPSRINKEFFRRYSAGLKAMKVAKVELILDALVLSEFLNRYCRIEWEACRCQYPKFKSFRNSANFQTVGAAAALYARHMLKICTSHDHPFASVNITRVLDDFGTGTDFNDGMLTETCRHNGWKLVTNDGDFTSGGIEVLTINKRLLAACR